MKDDSANQTQHDEYLPTYELDEPDELGVIHDTGDFWETRCFRLLLFLPFLPFLYVWVAGKKLSKAIKRIISTLRKTK